MRDIIHKITGEILTVIAYAAVIVIWLAVLSLFWAVSPYVAIMVGIFSIVLVAHLQTAPGGW